jgi:hypothetical protein
MHAFPQGSSYNSFRLRICRYHNDPLEFKGP